MTDIPTVTETANLISQYAGLNSKAESTGEGFHVASRDETADWYDECAAKINELKVLEHNWDSYGANPVSADSIYHAKRLLKLFAGIIGIDCPSLSASPDGNAGFSWQWADDTRELDLEVRPDGRLHYSYINETNPHEDCEDTTQDVDQVLYFLTKW